MTAWWAKYREQQVAAADLYELVEQNDIDIPINGKDDAGRRRSFGLRLKSQRDRVYEGYQLVSPGTVKGSAKAWKLVPTRKDEQETGESGESESLPIPDRENGNPHRSSDLTPLSPLTPDPTDHRMPFERMMRRGLLCFHSALAGKRTVASADARNAGQPTLPVGPTDHHRGCRPPGPALWLPVGVRGPDDIGGMMESRGW